MSETSGSYVIISSKFFIHVNTKVKKKSKAVSVTGYGGLYGCEMLRIPRCLDVRLTDGGMVVSRTHRPRSSTQKRLFLCFWYSFLLEAE
jgi:hypothetical protein